MNREEVDPTLPWYPARMTMTPTFRRRLIWYLMLAFFLLMFLLTLSRDPSPAEIEREMDWLENLEDGM